MDIHIVKFTKQTQPDSINKYNVVCRNWVIHLVSLLNLVDPALSIAGYNEFKIHNFSAVKKNDETMDKRTKVQNSHKTQQRTFQG